MPAVIQINSDGLAPREYWIRNGMMRIGSSPSCDLTIESTTLEAHAATLRYSDGRYLLINRSGRDIQVGTTVLSAGDTLPWQEGTLLKLCETISLNLVIQGSAEPSPDPSEQDMIDIYRMRAVREREQRAAEIIQNPPEVKVDGEEVPAGSDSARMQAFLGICMLLLAVAIGGGVALMVLLPESSTQPLAWNHPTKIGPFLLAYSDQLPEQLARELQEVQQAVALNNADMARHRLEKLSAITSKINSAAQTPMVIRAKNKNGEDKEIEYQHDLMSYISYYQTMYVKK